MLVFLKSTGFTKWSSKPSGHEAAAAQAAMKDLEAIVHPLVVSERDKYLTALPKGSQLVLFDIPLLYETAGEDQVLRRVVFDRL